MDTNLRSIATSPPISLGTPFQYKFGEEIFKSDEDGEYTEEELRLNTLSNTHNIQKIYKQYTDPHTKHQTPHTKNHTPHTTTTTTTTTITTVPYNLCIATLI